jgi:hypothetical protein
LRKALNVTVREPSRLFNLSGEGGQQELADEIRDLAGCLPKASSGLASVGGAKDPNDGADMIGPFGIGEGGVRIEDLDDAGFVTRSPLGVLGRSLINGGRGLAHPFGALVQPRLVVLELGDQQGAGRLTSPELT